MRNKKKEKIFLRSRRRARIRAKIHGTKECPRLSVFRSLRFISAQLIDDDLGHTLIGIHSKNENLKGSKQEQAFKLGKILAQRAREKGIQKIVFDKGGYKYHGRVKSLADGAREGGLEF